MDPERGRRRRPGVPHLFAVRAERQLSPTPSPSRAAPRRPTTAACASRARRFRAAGLRPEPSRRPPHGGAGPGRRAGRCRRLGRRRAVDADERRDARSESDAFWRALKEKDAEIERLQAELARMDAEKAGARRAAAAAARAPVGSDRVRSSRSYPMSQALAVPAAAAASAGGAGRDRPRRRRSWPPQRRSLRLRRLGPATAARLLRAGRAYLGRDAGGVRQRARRAARRRGRTARRPLPAPADRARRADTAGRPRTTRDAAGVYPPIVFENTQPLPALTDEMIAADAAAPTAPAAVEEAETTLTPETGAEAPLRRAPRPAPPRPSLRSPRRRSSRPRPPASPCCSAASTCST